MKYLFDFFLFAYQAEEYDDNMDVHSKDDIWKSSKKEPTKEELLQIGITIAKTFQVQKRGENLPVFYTKTKKCTPKI